VVWQRAIGSEQEERAVDLTQTWDNGYIISGCRSPWRSVTTRDAIYMKTDNGGHLEWQRHFALGYHCGHRIRQVEGGGYVIGVYSLVYTSPELGFDGLWIFKTNEDGLISDSCPPEIAGEWGAMEMETSAALTSVTPAMSDGQLEAWPLETALADDSSLGIRAECVGR
jgi:hypothetical protein